MTLLNCVMHLMGKSVKRFSQLSQSAELIVCMSSELKVNQVCCTGPGNGRNGRRRTVEGRHEEHRSRAPQQGN